MFQIHTGIDQHTQTFTQSWQSQRLSKVYVCMCLKCFFLAAADAMPNMVAELGSWCNFSACDTHPASQWPQCRQYSILLSHSILISRSVTLDYCRVCYRGFNYILSYLIYLKYNLFLRMLIFHPYSVLYLALCIYLVFNQQKFKPNYSPVSFRHSLLFLLSFETEEWSISGLNKSNI